VCYRIIPAYTSQNLLGTIFRVTFAVLYRRIWSIVGNYSILCCDISNLVKYEETFEYVLSNSWNTRSIQVLFILLILGTFFPFNFATSTTGGSKSPFLNPDGFFDPDAVDLFPLSVMLTFFRVPVSSVVGFRALFTLEVHRPAHS
jgi:hypothetical protein